MGIRTRLTRWMGLFSIGIRRTISRATVTARQRVLLSIVGVGLAIGLLLIVTGIGIGLATSTTVYDDEIDYWIVPDDDSSQSPLIATDNPQFGSVHETSEQIAAIDGVDGTTPVLTQVLRVDGAETAEYILVVGIINTQSINDVVGLNSSALTTNDPFYANGTYDGPWTGEVVLSESAADNLNASIGEQITIGGDDSFTVVDSASDTEQGLGTVPTALVQLSELQTLTGSATYDQADQFVVKTTTSDVKPDLEAVYPQSSVHSRTDLTASETMDSDISLALAITAFVVTLVIGTLFVITTMGLEIATDRHQFSTMSAIGISSSSQLSVISVQTLTTVGLGGLLGSVIGVVGTRAVNEIAVRTITTESIAVFHPLFVGYGLVVSLAIGLLALPCLLLVSRRFTRGVPA